MTIVIDAFVGATLATVIIGAALFIIARRWLISLAQIVAHNNEFNQEIIVLLRSMMNQQERIAMIQDALHESFSKELELIRQPLVSLTGDTARLRQQIEYSERKQRGNAVPELKQRQYRTVEENDIIASRGE